MIQALSYVIAVILTLLIAMCLYPIAVLFWLFGWIGKILVHIFVLLGKASDAMFKFTTKVIRSLWDELKGAEKNQQAAEPFRPADNNDNINISNNDSVQ